MRGLHLADLHLGKRLKEFSLMDEQRDVLNQVIAYCQGNHVDFVILAGDVFDKVIPSVEAMELFEEFLADLSMLQIKVLVLGGNHDNAERLAYLGTFLKKHDIHPVTEYKGAVEKILWEKDGERVAFHMLPFVKPADVRRFLPEEEKAALVSYHDAVKTALQTVVLENGAVNILVAHQFVTGSSRCESEDVTVGGLDNVGAEVMEDFDYVALGHIHSPQTIAKHEYMRYSGTPLKYSFSECDQVKSMTVLDIEQGQVKVTTEPFKVLHDLKKLKGGFAELANLETAKQYEDCYVHVTLTDEEEKPNVLGELRSFYPKLCFLTFENSRTARSAEAAELDLVKSPVELITEFFQQRSGHELSQEQKSYVEELLAAVQEEQ